MARKVNVSYHTGESKTIKVKGDNSSLSQKVKNDRYLERKTTNARQMESLNTGMSLFGLIVTVLLAIAVIRVLAGYEGLSFTSLLEALGNAPNIQMPLSSSINMFNIGGEWVILDGLRRTINSLGSILGVALWCAQGLVQCILYFAYFIGFIFVG